MNIADLLFWPSLLMFVFALIFLGMAWFYEDSVQRPHSERYCRLARWLVFLSGAICGASALLAGFVEFHKTSLNGGLGMILGFFIIQLALLLAPSRKLLEKRAAKNVRR
jgi:hypothetical protein